MDKNIYKLIAVASAFSLTDCVATQEKNAQVVNTYSMQTCDREEKAYFVELEHNNQKYTGIISTDNAHRIPETEKKFKIGKHVSFNDACQHFDILYLERE